MNHLEFAELESAQLVESGWDTWVKEVRRLVGHDLDSDESEDGYSLDGVYAHWEQGQSAQDCAADVKARRCFITPRESILS